MLGETKIHYFCLPGINCTFLLYLLISIFNWTKPHFSSCMQCNGLKQEVKFQADERSHTAMVFFPQRLAGTPAIFLVGGLPYATGRPRSDTVLMSPARHAGRSHLHRTFTTVWRRVLTLSHLTQAHLCHYPVCESRRLTNPESTTQNSI